MTTGRINQVTILSPSTEMHEQTPAKGASFTEQGDAEALQVAALSGPGAPAVQATDSIAPTEFPKGWSATSHAGCCHRYISAACIPQEEKISASSRTCVRKLSKTVPEDLVNSWQSQQSTDPKESPL